jgi:hypothetical protein
MDSTPLLFAPRATRLFAERMASTLRLELAPLEEREFEGGEHKSRPLVSVRSRDVYVVQSLSGDELGSANDRLCRLLFLVACLKDCGARLGGVHFELTGENVTECVGGASGVTEEDLQRDYRTQVDPRLNYEQAMEMAMLLASLMAKHRS